MQRLLIFTGIIYFMCFLSGCTLISPKGPRAVDLQNGICQDTKSGLMWVKVRSKKIHNLEEAIALSVSLDQGGHNDWRLPSISELYDIYYLYDLRRGFECDMRIEGHYWLINNSGSGEVGSWESLDNCGRERTYYRKESGHVLAVRGGKKTACCKKNIENTGFALIDPCEKQKRDDCLFSAVHTESAFRHDHDPAKWDGFVTFHTDPEIGLVDVCQGVF